MEDTIEFTDDERKIWDWWSEESKKLNLYVLLSDEDKQVFSKGIKIQDDETAVIRSRKNYVKPFFDHFSNTVTLPYDFDQVLVVVLKKTKQMHLCAMPEPKTASDVPAYVFAKLLSVDEQNAFREENFCSNRSASEAAVQRFANLVADCLVSMGFVKNDQRNEKQNEVFESRWSTLVKSYSK